MTQST